MMQNLDFQRRVADVKKILFVCTGNTCRSPMAEVIFRKISMEKGLGFEAQSAGICTITWLPASQNSTLAMEEIGVDLKQFCSTDISELNLQDYALIAVMTEEHRRMLTNVFGVDEERIYILGGDSGGISDPYGGSLGVYRQTRDEIKEAIEILTGRLCDDFGD